MPNKQRWPGNQKMKQHIKRIRHAHKVAKKLTGATRYKICWSCYGALRYCKTCLGTGELNVP